MLEYVPPICVRACLCGTTNWKAAKAVSKTMSSLDETGLEVAGCRHALALKALNMFRGEVYVELKYTTYMYVIMTCTCRFGYPHYLHTKHFFGVQCVCGLMLSASIGPGHSPS